MSDEVKVVKGIVRATTEKYGGGVKIEDKFYSLSEGLEMPEKGACIEAKVKGKKIIEWKSVEDCDEDPLFNVPDEIKIPKAVKVATDTYAAILKRLDEIFGEKMSKDDKRIVANVIYREVMELKRVALIHGLSEDREDR